MSRFDSVMSDTVPIAQEVENADTSTETNKSLYMYSDHVT